MAPCYPVGEGHLSSYLQDSKEITDVLLRFPLRDADHSGGTGVHEWHLLGMYGPEAGPVAPSRCIALGSPSSVGADHGDPVEEEGWAHYCPSSLPPSLLWSTLFDNFVKTFWINIQIHIHIDPGSCSNKSLTRHGHFLRFDAPEYT